MKLQKRKIQASTFDDVAYKLDKEITDKVIEVMQSPEFGYDKDEAEEYSYIETSQTGDGFLKVEVRAEVSYDGLSMIMDELNPIVEKYDPDAYFDAEAPGITTAYLEI